MTDAIIAALSQLANEPLKVVCVKTKDVTGEVPSPDSGVARSSMLASGAGFPLGACSRLSTMRDLFLLSLRSHSVMRMHYVSRTSSAQVTMLVCPDQTQIFTTVDALRRRRPDSCTSATHARSGPPIGGPCSAAAHWCCATKISTPIVREVSIGRR